MMTGCISDKEINKYFDEKNFLQASYRTFDFFNYYVKYDVNCVILYRLPVYECYLPQTTKIHSITIQKI